MTHRLLIVFAVGLVIVVTSAPAAPVAPPPREVVRYFPTTVGAKWVHLWKTEGRQDGEVVEVVMAVEPREGGVKSVTVGRPAKDGKTWPTEKFEVSARGLMWTENLVGYGGYPCPPHFQVKLPHRDGQTWVIDPTFPNGMRLRARGPERVTVPAGSYDCIRVEYVGDHTPPYQTRWYAPGVGQVKVWSGDLQVELKSFTPGNDRTP